MTECLSPPFQFTPQLVLVASGYDAALGCPEVLHAAGALPLHDSHFVIRIIVYKKHCCFNGFVGLFWNFKTVKAVFIEINCL